jgi:hypothetical protein
VAVAYGGWRWWTVAPDALATRLCRAGQAAAAVLAIVAGVAWATGSRPDQSLFWVYAVVPLAVSFFAEQIRALSAQSVLDARGLADAQAVGRLPEAEQRSVVRQIVRRELGVLVLAALVVVFLAVRAINEAPGL